MTCPIIYDFGKKTPHFFLSNFYPHPVRVALRVYDPNAPFGKDTLATYPSSEHAYQASKTMVDKEREEFLNPDMPPGKAKRLGRVVVLRPDWVTVRVPNMLEIIRVKFQDPNLRQMLLDTAPLMLMEGNFWHDLFWGVCFCPEHQGEGLNKLGKVLMAVRREMQATPPETH